MSFFDTIRCHACRAQIDPDSIGGRSGMKCPSCGTELNPADLFGLSDAFVGIDEDDGNDLSLEDLTNHRHNEDPFAEVRKAEQGRQANRKASARAAHAERTAEGPKGPIGALELMKEMKKDS